MSELLSNRESFEELKQRPNYTGELERDKANLWLYTAAWVTTNHAELEAKQAAFDRVAAAMGPYEFSHQRVLSIMAMGEKIAKEKVKHEPVISDERIIPKESKLLLRLHQAVNDDGTRHMLSTLWEVIAPFPDWVIEEVLTNTSYRATDKHRSSIMAGFESSVMSARKGHLERNVVLKQIITIDAVLNNPDLATLQQ